MTSMNRRIAAWTIATAAVFTLTACSGASSEVAETSVAPAGEVVEEVVEVEAPELTVAQANAVRAAENYLKLLSFSRDGLIAQLEFEDYSTEDAAFAVDHLDVDWNEQAARKAQEYLDLSAFSRQGLIDQLVFDKFTNEQAEHGATAVGL